MKRGVLIPWILVAAVAGLLVSGTAEATIKQGDKKPTATTTGGVEVAPKSARVRVQCWQDGRKIIDESDLAIVSLSIANQVNGMRLRRTGSPDSGVTLVTQLRTACLLAPNE